MKTVDPYYNVNEPQKQAKSKKLVMKDHMLCDTFI